MRIANWATLAVPALLALAAGCQRLNYSKTFDLNPLAVQELEFDAPAYAQRLTVTVAPTSAGVSAYLMKAADREAVERALQADKQPAASLLLASRVSTGAPETYSFEATVPAKTPYTLLLKAGPKTTQVKATVVGR
jgi:hypothetical protein